MRPPSPAPVTGPGEGVFVTRSGRQTRCRWRVEDVLPDAPGSELDQPHASSPLREPEPVSPLPPAVNSVPIVTDAALCVTTYTSGNHFGVRQIYKRTPFRDPATTDAAWAA